MHGVISVGFWSQKSSFFHVFAENFEFFLYTNHILAGRKKCDRSVTSERFRARGHQNGQNHLKTIFSTPSGVRQSLSSGFGDLCEPVDNFFGVFMCVNMLRSEGSTAFLSVSDTTEYIWGPHRTPKSCKNHTFPPWDPTGCGPRWFSGA